MANYPPSHQHSSEATSQWHAHFYQNQQLSFHINIPILTVEYHFAQQLSPIPHLHNIIAFTIPALLGFFQIQTGGNAPSSFELHPRARASLISILGYYLAFRVTLWFPRYASQLAFLMAVFGSFCVASLVSLLLPDSWWHVKAIIYVVVFLCEFLQIIGSLYDKYVRGRRQPPWYMTSTRQLLPQTYMDLGDHDNHHSRGNLVHRRV